MTFKEYERRSRGYQIREQKQRHYVRRLLHGIISPNLKKGRKLTLEEIDHLSYFDVKVKKEYTKEDRERHLKIINELQKN